MPTGPKGQKCPADVIGNAVRVMRIATGEETEAARSGPQDASDVAEMAAGVSARLWSMEDVAALIEASEAPAKKRVQYGKWGLELE